MKMTEFRNPGKKYRGVTLWMLNDKLEKGELERQLREIEDKGIGAVITRTFNGLRTEYLSDEWMESMAAIVGCAEKLGIEVFFQAGYMPSAIPDLDFESAHFALMAVPKDDEPGENAAVIGEDGAYRYIQLRMPKVLDMFNKKAVDKYLEGAYEDTWFANFREQFGRTISSVWVDEPHFKPPCLPWGDVLKKRFAEDWGYRVEEHVPSLFVPEGDYMKIRHQYWRTVTILLLEGYFDRVYNWCEKHGVSFSGHLMGEDTLAAQTALTGACMPLYEKMQIPGIDHLTMSLNWSHWNMSEGNEYTRFIMTPKQCSSAANQFGKERVLAEMYAVSSQGITFEDRKQIADWFFILGINYRCLHGSFYSMRGRRKRIFAPHLSYQQPWWEDNRLISDYCSRISYAMQNGTFRADVLLLHPVESAWCMFSSPKDRDYKPEAIAPELAGMNSSFSALGEKLMRIHRGFEYGDEHIIAENGTVSGNMLQVGNMKYRAVLLPDLITLRKSTLDILNQFIDAGGTVLAAGAFPSRIDGEEDPGISSFTERIERVEDDEKSLAEALDRACEARISVHGAAGNPSDVFMHERLLDDGRSMVFLANTARERSVGILLSAKGVMAAEELRAVDGSKAAVPVRATGDRTGIPLSFAPLESHLLILDPDSEPLTAEKPRTKTAPVTEITRWKISRANPNALTLDYCRLKRGEGDFGERIPISAVKEILTEDDPCEGPITVRCEFDVETVPESIAVAVEDADKVDISINGTRVQYTGLPYYMDRSFMPVDIAAHVKKGRNVIEIGMVFTPLREPEGLAKLFSNVDGTEVESLYLIGDFAVNAAHSKTEPKAEHLRFKPEFSITAEPQTVRGELVDEGYPFFAGEIELFAECEIHPKSSDRIRLKMPGLETCLADIEVNGNHAGKIAWKPFELDISEHIVKGNNRIAVKLKNTLRNLLGPHHRPLVERDYNWGEDDYKGNWCRKTKNGYPYWYKHREEDTDAWTEDYCFAKFGIYGKTKIEVAREI